MKKKTNAPPPPPQKIRKKKRYFNLRNREKNAQLGKICPEIYATAKTWAGRAQFLSNARNSRQKKGGKTAATVNCE
jgi:hypothetical protein